MISMTFGSERQRKAQRLPTFPIDKPIRNKEIHEWLNGVPPSDVNKVGDVSCFMSEECSELSRDHLVSGN